MIPGQNKIPFIVMLEIALLIPFMISGQELRDIHYKFIQTDSSYSFFGSFKSDADPACLLDITFNFKHIKALAPRAKEVKLTGQGKNWNQISYTFRKFGCFENKTVWHRVLDVENRRVDFVLLTCKNNSALIPDIISSSGFYQIKSEDGYSIVEYYQQCRLTEKMITKIYLGKAKKDAIKFMNEFSKYAETICDE